MIGMIALDSLSESARKIALDRFRLLQPHLEEKRPLKAIARDAGIGYRTAQRWVMRYRKCGLAGLARNDRARIGVAAGDLAEARSWLARLRDSGHSLFGQLANPGKNHWMFDWLLGLSYLSHKTGTEFTMFGGFAVSTEDPATHYRNGDLVQLEATLQQYLPLSKQTLIGIGANAFYYQQVTADSGSGARLGGFEGTDFGVGPVVTLIHKAEKYNFSVQAKWLPTSLSSWVMTSAGLTQVVTIAV